VFWYFGYGSNLDAVSLRAKGVHPTTSVRAALTGWRLCFNVAHFFRHEGGVANIERTEDERDQVLGVAYLCDDAALAALDNAEAYPYGYDRATVEVDTATGVVTAIAYVGTAAFIDETCLPSQRYLNIVVRGAQAADLDAAYVEQLQAHPTHAKHPYPLFVAPTGRFRPFTLDTLSSEVLLTGLAGSVFDMSGARSRHDFLRTAFGGKDMTLFHLRRMDSSDGAESMDDIASGRLTPAQREYLNEYLNEYAREYRYVGTISYS
jgi:sulfite reductase (NADPH) flavoprotein alpha-component